MARIFIAGHRGMVGSAIARRLAQDGNHQIITRDSASLDLRDQLAVKTFFADTQIDQIYLAAARVGGIYANNTYPADFIYDNLMIEANIIHQGFLAGVRRLMFLGSSCIYPKAVPQPMKEDALLTGPLEPTNEPYAIAKIAGIKLCESYNRQFGDSHGVDFRSAMPTNLYGEGDNYHPENSHVVPALIRRFCEAKEAGAKSVIIWGTGLPRREFLHVDDLASASVHLMDIDKATYDTQVSPMQNHINVGFGDDITILELAGLIATVVGYDGDILTDPSRPDGTIRKIMDSSKMRSLGWQPRITLNEGLETAVADFRTRNAA
jgi:GDP-L-fucose synthase